jgi:hypothetical protein
MLKTIAPIAAALTLAGCNTPPPPLMDATTVHQMDAPRVWTDPKTGCEYLIEYEKGISARFHQNGLPICHGVEK